MVWKVDEEEHFKRLRDYETDAFTWCYVDATLEDGEVLSRCRAFCWDGEPDSRELEEGSFDLESYRRYYKASVVRKR